MAGDSFGLTRSAPSTPALEGDVQLRVNPCLPVGRLSQSQGLTNRLDYIRFFCYYTKISRCSFYFGGKMTGKEDELIQRLTRENEEFSKIKQAHGQLGKQLDELEKKPFLTPQDEMEIKIIKKKKLALKDQMEKILMQYR